MFQFRGAFARGELGYDSPGNLRPKNIPGAGQPLECLLIRMGHLGRQSPALSDHKGHADGNRHGQDDDHAGIDRTDGERLRDAATAEGRDRGLQRRRQHDANEQQE